MLKTPTQSLPVTQHSRLINKSPVFYGWIIMLVGTLGLILTSPGQTYAVSIFIEQFITDLALSRSLVSTLYTLGTLIGSLALPLIGRLIDRQGSRRMVTIIALLFGLACIYMGSVQNALMLGLGFLAIRMLGQGGLGLVSQNVINQWWVRRRGLVMGLSGLLTSIIGVGGFPIVINSLLPIYGWRVTYVLLGLLLIGLMLPLGALLFRPQPEVYGLQPDGNQATTGKDAETSLRVAEENWTLAEASRTLPFWILALGLALIAMLSTGLFFHMVSIFADKGLDSTVAASVFFPIAMTTAVVNLGGGMLADRVPPRLLLAAALVFQSLSLGLAEFMDGVELALMYGVALGATTGLMRIANSVVWANYFGRRHLGSISGTASTILVFGSALGPIPLGFTRDLWGSYTPALTALTILPLILGLVSLFTDRPRKRTGPPHPAQQEQHHLG
jgi:MFS family permease